MSIAQKAATFTNNIKVSFTKKQISTNVTYTYVQDFKDIIGFRQLLEKHLEKYEVLKASNSKYSVSDAVDFMTDAVFQGYSRFYHMEKLRKDEAYRSIHGGDAPSEKVCRDTLSLLPDDGRLHHQVRAGLTYDFRHDLFDRLWAFRFFLAGF